MRFSRFLSTGALLLLWLIATPAQAGGAKASLKKAQPGETCGEHGTSLHFEDSPSAAAKKALKEEKLVMVLHISGYFEDPAFT